MTKPGRFTVFGECEVEVEADNELDAMNEAEKLPISYWRMADLIDATPAEE